jgi:hypothetical protein
MTAVVVNGKKKFPPRKDDPWKTLVGEKGSGKSYQSLYEMVKYNNPRQNGAASNGLSNGSKTELISNNPPITGWVSSSNWGQPSRTDGNSGAPYTSQPYTNSIPAEQQHYIYGTGTTIPQQQQVWPYIPSQIQRGWDKVQQEQKHTTEELKGKLIAFATITINGVEHKGVLFVRKCGAWKLVECETMKKIASGSKDKKLPEVIVHYIIYSQFDDDNKKPKKSRFDNIDMKDPIEKE